MPLSGGGLCAGVDLFPLCREKHEKKWDNEINTGDRDAYIAEGMREYDSGFRKKLIVLVVVVPIVVVGVLLYAINFM